MEYSLEKIATVIHGKFSGKNHIISELLIDSRSSSAGSNSLFFAIIGKQHNGHLFLKELYRKGVRSFIISEAADFLTEIPDAGFIIVPDTLKALQKLAAYHRSEYSCKIIAITGSNGKTIVKEWLFHCLSNRYNITRSPKSYNSQVGVPLSICLLDENTTLGIFEAGISMPGEMQSLREMIAPHIGIFTNIGEAHQENFSDTSQKVKEKLQLFRNCEYLIYCADHSLIDKTIRETPSLKEVRLFSWSLKGFGNVNITSVVKGKHHTDFSVSFENQNFPISIPFTDDASIENALHCLTFMILNKCTEHEIAVSLSDLPPVAMRLEQKSGINNCTVINDSYNSDFNSLSIALDVLNRQIQHKTKTLILSDILQSGKNHHELYKRVSDLIHEKNINRIIGIGETIRENASVFLIPGKFYGNTDEFIHEFNPELFKDEAILLKGSRKFEFERIAALLEQKKHTTRIEINLQALTHNLNYFRSLLNPGVKTMVMVKALSYGNGRHEIANILQFQRVNYLGVAIADEGVSLRKAGINLPVIVMNPEAESFDTIIRYRLEPEIYSFGILELFHKAVIRHQEINYPVHLKLDTGMHRLGFLEEQVDELCTELIKYRNLSVRSVFSHLSGSDEPIFDDFTRQQIASFKKGSAQIADTLGYPIIRHILNTSGIERFPEAQFDMVRLGIGLYGVSSVEQSKLQNVSTLKSTILQVKPVNAGETVGYSRKGRICKLSEIAIVPIGYADGLNRKLGNGGGSFYIQGKLAPIIGNICMDMTMIDVTGLDVKEGDEVEIFGSHCTISEISEKLGTIPYEILTGVSERVKRVYFYE